MDKLPASETHVRCSSLPPPLFCTRAASTSTSTLKQCLSQSRWLIAVQDDGASVHLMAEARIGFLVALSLEAGLKATSWDTARPAPEQHLRLGVNA